MHLGSARSWSGLALLELLASVTPKRQLAMLYCTQNDKAAASEHELNKVASSFAYFTLLSHDDKHEPKGLSTSNHSHTLHS